MQQRRLRLGDILDDYCPRERRITNHAVVAMIEDTVKQTRCTTCDAEHEYKHAKVPAARRRKGGVLGAQLVEGPGRLPATVEELPEEMTTAEEPLEAAETIEAAEQTEVAADPETTPDDADAADVDDADTDRDEWPVHRPLIRATLPRPEGHTPERKAPDFTFRPAGGKFDRNGQRNRGHRPARHAHGQHGQPSGQGQRFGGQRSGGQGGQRGPGQGGGQGQRHGNRPGQGGSGRPGQGRGPRPGGGRKRGR